MIKVGDKIKFLAFEDDTQWEKKYGVELGGVYLVDSVSDKDLSFITDKNGTICFCLHGLVELFKEKSMVNYSVLKESIVVNFNGRTEVVSKADGRYADILDCIREGRLEDIPACVDIGHGFKDSGIELKDGILYQGEEAIPTELNDRILAYKDARLPYDSLLKFWENLKKNPSFNSRKMLFAFLENNGHPITEDGCFVAYRGVKDDFTDCHTGKWNNSPGSVCEMPRDQVDDNPNNTCSKGLHVACFDYAKGFGSKLMEVKVNPADVVTVPVDYKGTKMRTCRFEVIQECAEIRTELLYGNDAKAQEAEEEVKNECEDCGKEIDDDADKCDYCQAEFDETICQGCGEDRNEGDSFCPHCGHEHSL